MNLSTGIDLVSIAKIKSALQNPRFLHRVFSPQERALFSAKGTLAPQTIAANFAAKEAFAKALGTGVRGFSLSEVAVLRNVQGAPFFALSGRALQIVTARGLSMCVSLTHTEDTAAAMVVVYQAE